MKLQSPQGRAAFDGFLPSIVRREKVATVMGVTARHLPVSYPWAGTIVADNFYGAVTRPYKPRPGLVDDNTLDQVLNTIERRG